MVSDVGKSIALVQLSNGDLVNFFNKSYIGNNDIFYKDISGNIRYKITVDNNSIFAGYRCCHYVVSKAQSTKNSIPKVLPVVMDYYTEKEEDLNLTAEPLWEFISPTINFYGVDEYQLSWWSNVKNVPKQKALTSSSTGNVGEYIYNSSNILKFSQNDLGSVQESESAGKILCSASLKWQSLIYSCGTVNSFSIIPVIYNPIIIAYIQNEGLITDFSTGGGGGGNSIHGHTSNEDCGFAAAVFMPSANMRVLNWR